MPLTSHNVPAPKWQQEGALFPISRAGFMLPTIPRYGRGQQINCHRQDTGEVYKGLILPAAHAKIAGETPEVETQTLLRTSVYSQPSRELPVYL